MLDSVVSMEVEEVDNEGTAEFVGARVWMSAKGLKEKAGQDGCVLRAWRRRRLTVCCRLRLKP